MVSKLLILAPALLLAACGPRVTTPPPEPRIVTVEVPVPTPAPCVPANLAPPPEYVDSVRALLAAPDAASRMALLYEGRTQRDSRLSQVEPVVAACPREQPNR